MPADPNPGATAPDLISQYSQQRKELASRQKSAGGMPADPDPGATAPDLISQYSQQRKELASRQKSAGGVLR